MQPRPGITALGAAPTPATAQERRITLRVDYTEAAIRNPGTQREDKVRLRSYRHPDATPSSPFIAPTITLNPGETARVTLVNDLPQEPGCDAAVPHVNEPHCFNTTNLHSHGLWINPSGNGDNVLLSIRPKVTFEYEYNVPSDHPAGTFWYHPHRHGSTALQVSSGMVGALIIQGSRLPEMTTAADGSASFLAGDIDLILRQAQQPFFERILVLQQIQYACGPVVAAPGLDHWTCDPGETGTIESYETFGVVPNSGGQTTWDQSGRYTTVNGRTVEPFEEHAVVGRIERWRIIHGGVRDTIRFAVSKRLPAPVQPNAVAARDFRALSAREQEEWINANCADQGEQVWEIAADGLTREAASQREQTILQPGYRSDLLLVFKEPGEYCVLDNDTPEAATINSQQIGRRLLSLVRVDPAPDNSTGNSTLADPRAHLQAALVAAAGDLSLPPVTRDRIVADLESGLRLTAFVPHEDLRAATPTGTQPLVFVLGARNPHAVGGSGLPTGPGLGRDVAGARRYDPAEYSRVLTLGAIEDWVLSSAAAGHPFHIHVNPFQIISATRPGAAGAPATDLLQDPQSQYFGMAGVWKDTLFVEPNATITVRAHYRRYVGDFVLHCHILDHEDEGMMENVRIALPDGLGGQVQPGHLGAHHN